MHAGSQSTLSLLDSRSRSAAEPRVAAEREEAREEGGDEPIVCAACGEKITTRSERIAQDGSHEHSFVNPAGIIYRIGCFRSAPGCREAGELTGDWSWIPGYDWRYAICGSCAEHLGWACRGASGSTFRGLILPRLAEGHRH